MTSVESDTINRVADLLASKTVERVDPLGLKDCFHDWDMCKPEVVKQAIVKWLRKLAVEGFPSDKT